MSTAMPLIAADSPDTVRVAFDRLKAAFAAEPYPSLETRQDRLTRLERVLQSSRDQIVQAVAADFGARARAESLIADVLLLLEAIRGARRSLAHWMEPRELDVPWYLLPSRGWVEYQPKGAVAIIAPWNYPLQTCLSPLIPALAAGNRALLKPSELTPRSAELIATLIREAFSPDEVSVVTGGPEIAATITSFGWDHLFFTGSTRVGRMVARACAENLVPVTLELGGKSPAIVLPDYPLDHAAERIVVAKMFNAGQTCVAPDYVLLPRGQETRFTDACRQSVERAFPDFMRNPDVTSVATEAGFTRLQQLIEDARAQGARIEALATGEPPPGLRRQPPVLLWGVTDSMRVMQEEIFGPLLPVLTYDSPDEAIAHVTRRPRPLSLYVFDRNETRARELLRRTHAGNVCINDAMFQYAAEQLPFGGIGESGMGASHGKWGFDTFSHAKGVYAQSRLTQAARVLSPPYGATLARVLDFLIGGRSRR